MEYTSIYGVIKIDRDYDKAVEFIRSLGKDIDYPYLNTSMFSLGDYEVPYFYENMVISFGATYKSFGLSMADWKIFVVKMENVLRQIDFSNAKFNIESYVGKYIFNWVNKSKLDPYWLDSFRTEKYQFIETDEFFFGYGDRPIFVPHTDQRYNAKFDEPPKEFFTYPFEW